MTLICLMLRWGTCHYTFVQTRGTHGTKSGPHVNVDFSCRTCQSWCELRHMCHTSACYTGSRWTLYSVFLFFSTQFFCKKKNLLIFKNPLKPGPQWSLQLGLNSADHSLLVGQIPPPHALPTQPCSVPNRTRSQDSGKSWGQPAACPTPCPPPAAQRWPGKWWQLSARGSVSVRGQRWCRSLVGLRSLLDAPREGTPPSLVSGPHLSTQVAPAPQTEQD